MIASPRNSPSLSLQRPPGRYEKWVRRSVLALLFLAGLSMATLESSRPASLSHLWNRMYGVLTQFLNPVRERTHKVAKVAFRLDRLWGIEEQNQRMVREVSELRMENQMLLDELSRLNRLSGLGSWSGPPELSFLPSVVIGLVTNDQSAGLIIDKGWREGVRRRDPVVALGGLVGVVEATTEHTARVQAITDPQTAIGAVNRNSRARGVVVYGRDRVEPLAYVPENEDQVMTPGDELITSGFENSVYPKGIVIGKIKGISRNSFGIPYGVVTPAVSFSSLEEVLLVIPTRRLQGQEGATTSTLGIYQIAMPGLRDRATTATLSPSTATTATLFTAQALTTGSTPSQFDQATTATRPQAAVTAGATTVTTQTLPPGMMALPIVPSLHTQVKPVTDGDEDEEDEDDAAAGEGAPPVAADTATTKILILPTFHRPSTSAATPINPELAPVPDEPQTGKAQSARGTPKTRQTDVNSSEPAHRSRRSTPSRKPAGNRESSASRSASRESHDVGPEAFQQ